MAALRSICHNLILVFSLYTCSLLITSTASAGGHSHDENPAVQNWLNHGGDLSNRRYANRETKINRRTVSKLSLNWEFYTGDDISATPSIYDGTLYFPSWNGEIYAVQASNGSLVWKKNLHELTGLNATGFSRVNWTVARSTPTVVDDQDLLIVGIYGPAVVIALERSTGNLIWSTLLDTHAAGVITMSGTYHNGSIYIGTSSLEETLSPEECCTFRGSLAKLDAKSGTVLWKTFMLPDNHGQLGSYSGAAIWGSSPSIDVHRKHVYIATGNVYTVPENVSQCQENQNNSTLPTHPDACVEPDNRGNSILALDLDSGDVKWNHHLGGYDVWFRECFLNTSTCQTGPNVDADFGEAPMMLKTCVNGTKRDLVVAVQKSGFAWALDRNNGTLIWSTEAGPGGFTGGGTWGAATDKKKVYTNIANSESRNFTLKPSSNITTWGGWVAMAPENGKILWSTANPSNSTSSGPVSVANGILFAGSTNPRGSIYAMNTENGKILWSYDTGASVFGGMSISDGCIYVGSGYNKHQYTAGTSLFAFCVT
ncbi:unnamed protein product [Malus baccata var. baccata]